ncbi:MAG: tetratricopeptide repeat protein [Cyclobacteriaceae bacterium]|nr:tetratricopeptide repeat protein [Cyclobacteriaceae bacterium]MDH5251271.1 tetratricopeptide repeat protein [Cyclobacteriaceae bacterium]
MKGTVSNSCRAISLVVILIVAISAPSYAQRKKKNADDIQASGIRLREAEFYFTEGEKFFILEDYSKALLYYQRTLEITPENATVHYKVAEVLAHSNKQEDLLKASISIENALRLEKKNKYFYLLASNIYTSMAAFDKAAAVYETMIKEVKGAEEYLYELAAVYQYANRFEDAIKTYNRAESLLGINEISSIQKLRLFLELGKTKEGIAEGEKLINAFPGEDRFVMGFAETLSQKGLRAEAIRYLEEFTATNPDSGNVKMLLAGLYRDNSQEQKARELLASLFDDSSVELGSKVIILGSYNAELNQNRTNNISDPDKENFARSLFEKLVKQYPSDPDVHILGGDLYLSIGKSHEAQIEYASAIGLGQVNFEVWENLLYLETQLEQFDKVIEHSDEALEIFPNQSMIYYFNGYANLRRFHYPEAIVSLEQAKKLSASQPKMIGELNSMLGDAYNATKAYDKSDKAYEEALAINPNNDAVLNNYSYYLALRKANLEKAEKMSSLLVKNNPDNPTFLDTHAWVLYSRQKYKEARKVMERAIITGNATATHFEHYGDILFQLGDVGAAVQQWEKARGLNANSEILNKKIANRKIYE